tara:strand:- start:10274 stop:11581 length:1308 start_codon:yes stop_codon:yes gene_type:complete
VSATQNAAAEGSDKIEQVPVESLIVHPDNPRVGDVSAIANSIHVNGWWGTLVAQRSTNYVLAGNHRLLAAQSLGMETVPVYWVDVDDDHAVRILLADNRTSDLGSYDDEALITLLESLAGDYELEGVGWDADALEDLVQMSDLDAVAARSELVNAEAPEPGSLSHNVDVIFCQSDIALSALVKTSSRWDIGVISSSVTERWLERCEALGMRKKIRFVDNEFKEYDHDVHVAAVKELNPKYATVRDVMTRPQCEEAGIDFYPLEQILEMAAEVQEHAERVMLIPKYDCLDDIPEEFMLGYSVPSSYGGTPMPLEAFKGRDTHLLGGSWKLQRNALAVLGKDVVSLDNNNIMTIAKYGVSTTATGGQTYVNDTFKDEFQLSKRVYTLPLLYSLSAILSELHNIGVGVNGYAHEDNTDDEPDWIKLEQTSESLRSGTD